MKRTVRFVLRLSVVFTLLTLMPCGIQTPAAVAAEDYPTKPITVLIPWNPGGGTDTTIRLVDKAMPKYLDQRLVLVNRPGGHGTIAMTELVNSRPDGYTLCITASGPTTSVPHKEKVAYTMDDYIPIIQLTNVPNLLVTHPGSPYKSFQDVMAAAKKDPGSVKVAVSGIGAVSSHLPLIRIEKQAGTKFTVIPYKGGGDAAVAVMGGHIPLGSVDIMAAGSKIDSGALIPLAIFDEKRSADLPDVPTLKEMGFDIQGSFFNMIIAPKGTPQAILDTLHAAFKKALMDEETLSTAKELGLPIAYANAQQCRQRIQSDYEIIGELYKELGLAKK